MPAIGQNMSNLPNDGCVSSSAMLRCEDRVEINRAVVLDQVGDDAAAFAADARQGVPSAPGVKVLVGSSPKL
ncbi:MAG TPA: hypothetical protein VM345_15310 [Acidimicrobiales bacterium]|nr:hypothetical protein [Acidimicrobiales bacterium]